MDYFYFYREYQLETRSHKFQKSNAEGKQFLHRSSLYYHYFITLPQSKLARYVQHYRLGLYLRKQRSEVILLKLIISKAQPVLVLRSILLSSVCTLFPLLQTNNLSRKTAKKRWSGTFLVVQGLRPCTSSAGGMALVGELPHNSHMLRGVDKKKFFCF